MKYTNDCVQVTNTATGAGMFAYMGQAYRPDTTLAVDVTTSVVPFTVAANVWRGGQRWRPDGRRLVTKEAPGATTTLDNGIARTLDGRQHVATAAVAGAPVVRYIEGLPYDAAGRLKISEV